MNQNAGNIRKGKRMYASHMGGDTHHHTIHVQVKSITG